MLYIQAWRWSDEALSVSSSVLLFHCMPEGGLEDPSCDVWCGEKMIDWRSKSVRILLYGLTRRVLKKYTAWLESRLAYNENYEIE